jgi:hypothetical protein
MLRSSTHAIAAMLVRAGAVMVFCASAIWAVGMATRWQYFEESGMTAYAGFLMSGALLLCAVMWLFADHIASISLSRRTTSDIESNIDEKGWLRIAIAAIGFYQLLQGLTGLLNAGLIIASGRAAQSPDGQALFGRQPSDYLQYLWEPLAQFIAAIILLLGARGIVNLFNAIRDRGMPRDYAPPPTTPTKEDA